MAKVYGVHQVELREGVTPEEFEKFMAEEWHQLSQPDGVSWYLVKGDKGRDEGNYLFLLEIESVERRDELFPRGATSEEHQRWREANAATWEKLWSMAEHPFGTDYVVVGL